jgi:hypothetical protein
MSDFYHSHGKMKSLVTGDMAKEALAHAEDEYLMIGDVHLVEEERKKFNPPGSQDFQPKHATILGVRCRQYFRDDRGWMGVWKKGDIWFNGTEYEYVSDSWEMEDVRLDEIVYRPIK